MGIFVGSHEGRGGLDPFAPGGGLGAVSFGTFVTKMSTWRAELGTRERHLLTIDAHHAICAKGNV